MKRCSKCGVEKSLDDFYFSRTINSYQYRCKACTKEYMRARRETPYRDAERERLRRMRQEHPERHREYNRRHRALYPERMRAYDAWRRSRIARATSQDEAYIAILRCDPCSYCGNPAGTVDHIEPLRFGGDVHWSNLTAACRRCNAAKGTESLLTFITTNARVVSTASSEARGHSIQR